MNLNRGAALALVSILYFLFTAKEALAQSAPKVDAIETAQIELLHHMRGAGLGDLPVHMMESVILEDPIHAAQVMQAVNRTFPNLSEDLKISDLVRKAAADPTMRGNLRGRLAEDDFLKRNAIA